MHTRYRDGLRVAHLNRVSLATSECAHPLAEDELLAHSWTRDEVQLQRRDGHHRGPPLSNRAGKGAVGGAGAGTEAADGERATALASRGFWRPFALAQRRSRPQRALLAEARGGSGPSPRPPGAEQQQQLVLQRPPVVARRLSLYVAVAGLAAQRRLRRWALRAARSGGACNGHAFAAVRRGTDQRRLPEMCTATHRNDTGASTGAGTLQPRPSTAAERAGAIMLARQPQ
mmetsp:Transcript_58044/g.160631  ORF Transcript_58044/g.160631 Transcript_58044/m.160631 type:complete len:230 (-) Transcript_58044:41-730(-)